MYVYEFYVEEILDLSYISYYITESGSLLLDNNLFGLYWKKEEKMLEVIFEFELDSLEYQELYNIVEKAKLEVSLDINDLEDVNL